MSTTLEFSVVLDGSPVVARLERPDDTDNKPLPVVLLCAPLPVLGPEGETLRGHITAAMLDAGLAVVTLVEGSAGSRGSRLAVESVDDAAAVLHGLATREDVDLRRLGIFGHSIGAIIAACLARRTDSIAGVCLLSPPTADEVTARSNGNEIAAQMGAIQVPPGFFDGVDTLSPTEDLAAYDRPTLILHGAADRMVSPQGSVTYRDTIAAAGHTVDYALVARGDHYFTDDEARSACLDLVTRFFCGLTRESP